ncbi:sugar phosphate isomerase/epimerase family protein [Mycetocola spongiae]|uniref:sugar phosphate isomerase/epimerase family protein n=1 Tax=Mycetocola spongiae TaxID=2859226 RepID=UPI001CF5270A|nr:sugar phosphate isomerase/epimerase family protein [Mycetocola spongiae]UCR88636.1 sugar phosphate isomerase/epimerase [Mycetocola spongiae]
MRISVFPKGEMEAIATDKTMTVFEWITLARTLPIEGLELYSRFFWDRPAGFVEAVGDALAAADFEMPMMCSSPDFTHPDPEVRKRELDLQRDIMLVTHQLGGAGSSTRVLSGQRHPGVSVEQGLDWATEAIQELLPLAHELDITLGLENHYKDGFWAYPEFAQRPEVFLALLDRIEDRTHFGVQFDPSNAITAGTNSADFLELVIDRVVTMQASDRRLAPGATLESLRGSDGTIGYSPDLQHGVIGEGLNDYDRIFNTLVGAGYDGWISVEDGVNGMHEMRASVEFLREARDRYFGGSTALHVENHERARAAAGERSLDKPNLEKGQNR